MKKSILVFYLLILTIAVKEPVFAKEDSSFSKSTCRDVLIAHLPDQGQDILSGAIMIAYHFRPSSPQVTLYHIFLAAMTEVHVDGAPITYINPSLLAFLRRQNLLEDFQNFLLNNIGLSGDRLDSLFEKKSNGRLVLNTNIRFDHNYISNFDSYTPDANRLLTIVTQNKEIDSDSFSNDFFLYILRFDNPIRKFFFDHLTELSVFLRGIDEGKPDEQRMIEEIDLMYHGNGSLTDLLRSNRRIVPISNKREIPTNPFIVFDIVNKRASLINGYPHYLVMNPPPYFPPHHISSFTLFDLFLELEENSSFIKVLEQQTVDDSNRFYSL